MVFMEAGGSAEAPIGVPETGQVDRGSSARVLRRGPASDLVVCSRRLSVSVRRPGEVDRCGYPALTAWPYR